MTITINDNKYPLNFWGRPSENELLLMIRAEMLPVITDLSATNRIVVKNGSAEDALDGYTQITSVNLFGGVLNVLLRRAT